MKPTVLDTSALLAMFLGEPGMGQMRELFQREIKINWLK